PAADVHAAAGARPDGHRGSGTAAHHAEADADPDPGAAAADHHRARSAAGTDAVADDGSGARPDPDRRHVKPAAFAPAQHHAGSSPPPTPPAHAARAQLTVPREAQVVRGRFEALGTYGELLLDGRPDALGTAMRILRTELAAIDLA